MILGTNHTQLFVVLITEEKITFSFQTVFEVFNPKILAVFILKSLIPSRRNLRPKITFVNVNAARRKKVFNAGK